MKKIFAVLVSAIAVLSITACSPDTTQAAPPPASAPTVTVTAPAPPPVVKVVKQDVTPTACLQFISDSEKLVNLAADALDLSSQAVDAISRGDQTQLSKVTTKINALSPKISKARSQYDDSMSECQNS